LREVTERMREVTPDAPRTHVGILHIEERGTDRLSIMRAFAHVYGLPLAEIESACRRCTDSVNCA